ncbi:hypothetical protein ADK52_08770 [Streptomyces sp. WM6372]|uniref:hypothetical protein n=1 Tax=Streptomyces sp. WM6372 TaxID=1415555 RepID=UPI0006AFC28F|nr:hypothetical protein [Streptomyces sp. WM6372]KOU26822.1 hypothetical protein ADK52_08770 [Streptomyces sp. WM6372]
MVPRAVARRAAARRTTGSAGSRHFADRNEAEVLDRRGAPLQGVARCAVDPAGARRPWSQSEEMLADADAG